LETRQNSMLGGVGEATEPGVLPSAGIPPAPGARGVRSASVGVVERCGQRNHRQPPMGVLHLRCATGLQRRVALALVVGVVAALGALSSADGWAAGATASPAGEYVDPLMSENVLEIGSDGSCYIEILGLNVGETGTWKVSGTGISLLFPDGTTIRGTLAPSAIVFASVPLMSPVWIRRDRQPPSAADVVGDYARPESRDEQIVVRADGTYQKRERGLFAEESLETGEWELNGYVVRFRADNLFSTETVAVYLDGRLYVSYFLEFRVWAQRSSGTQGTLTVVVRDAASKNPISDAMLSLTPNSWAAWARTDSAGSFSCTLAAGEYEVRAYAPETREASQAVVVRGGAEASVVLELDADPPWRRNIQVGDILYDPCTLWRLGHVGIYVGDGRTADPQLDGILHDLGSWDKRGQVQILRVTCPKANLDCARDAAAWARSLADRIGSSYRYQIPVLDGVISWELQKDPDPEETEWYCSELVWAAYYHQRVDIEAFPGNLSTGMLYNPGLPVSPNEICEDLDTMPVGGHTGGTRVTILKGQCDCGEQGTLRATCPVDLVLTDPEGRSASRTENAIPGSLYWTDDFDADGSIDAQITFPISDGVYEVRVVPWQSAAASDSYSLTYSSPKTDHPLTIADRQPVSRAVERVYTLEIREGAARLPERPTGESENSTSADAKILPEGEAPPASQEPVRSWIVLACLVLGLAAAAATWTLFTRRRASRRSPPR